MRDYTIYTKPECAQCDQANAYFDRKGITYTSVDITEVATARVYVTEERGYSQVPVVVSNRDDQNHWRVCVGTSWSKPTCTARPSLPWARG